MLATRCGEELYLTGADDLVIGVEDNELLVLDEKTVGESVARVSKGSDQFLGLLATDLKTLSTIPLDGSETC